MRILHVANKQLRRYGKTHGNWVEKLAYGLIKNNHQVLSFSERDVAAFEAPFGLRDLGWKRANQRLLEMVESTIPDLIIFGHCDKITDDTVRQIRKSHPHIPLAHVNCDPLFVPNNVKNIHGRAATVDAVFVTTGKRQLAMFEGHGARIYHMPNPVDQAFELLDNSTQTALDIDLLFCSNATKFSTRGVTVQFLKDNLETDISFKTPGSFGEPAAWGRDYDQVLSRTRMALNLNRQEGDYWYSSDRMAQLAGNGILQLTNASQGFHELLPPESMAYFKDDNDLLNKVREFHHDDARRQAWAKTCRDFFFAEVNTELYARYIVEATVNQVFSHDYVWARDTHANGQLK